MLDVRSAVDDGGGVARHVAAGVALLADQRKHGQINVVKFIRHGSGSCAFGRRCRHVFVLPLFLVKAP
jgi:hypothetical protein